MVMTDVVSSSRNLKTGVHDFGFHRMHKKRKGVQFKFD
jgi:hypothetical protein